MSFARSVVVLSLAFAACGGPPASTQGALGEMCDPGPTCDPGLACFLDVPGGECSKPCATDGDCGQGAVCAGGRCHVACVSSNDCARDGFACGSGYCAPPPRDGGVVDQATGDAARDLATRDFAGADLPFAPDLSTPDLAMPDLAMADLAMADLAMADLAMADLATHDLAMPDLSMPDLAVPDLALPDLAVNVSDMSAPARDFAGTAMDLGFAMTPTCSRRFGDAMDQTGRNVVVDAQDHFFFAGELTGTLDFDGNPLTSAGARDIFVAKMDSNCQTIWAHRYGDAADQSFDYLAPLIAVDATGALYVAIFNNGGTVDFGNGVPPVTGSTALVKLDADGNAVWARGFAIPSGIVTSIATDGGGNLTLAGYFSGSFSFGGPALTTPNNVWEVFVARLDPMGNHLWSVASTGIPDASNIQRAVAVDANGDVLITGGFYTTICFGGNILVDPNPDTGDGRHGSSYLAKLSGANGAHLFSQAFDFSNGLIVTTDPARNVIFSGILFKTSDFGTGPLTTAGSFLVKLDPLGKAIWGKSFPTEVIYNLVADGAGDIFLTALLNAPVDFGGGLLTPTDGLDLSLAAFGPDGAHHFSKMFPGQGDSNGVALGPAGDVVMVGDFWYKLDVGLGPLVNVMVPDAGPRTTDVFVSRFLR